MRFWFPGSESSGFDHHGAAGELELGICLSGAQGGLSVTRDFGDEADRF